MEVGSVLEVAGLFLPIFMALEGAWLRYGLTFDSKPCRVCSVPRSVFTALDRLLSSLVVVAADLTP